MERPAKKYRKLTAFIQKGSLPEDSTIRPDMINPYLAWESRVKETAGTVQEALERQTGEEDRIYLIGTVGEAGTVLLENWKHDTLCSYFPEWFVKTAVSESTLSDSDESDIDTFIKNLFNAGVTDVYPVGEGGFLKTIYDLGKKTGLGFRIQAETVPVRQVVIEFCEYFDLHPWELLSCGCCLVTASGSRAESEIRKCAQDIPVVCIGNMTSEKQKAIVRGEDISSINHPLPDALLKVMTAGTGKQDIAEDL